MAPDFTNEKSSLVQVMASCRRVHIFMSPRGVTRPQLNKYIMEIDGLVQDNSNCIADALELLQPCTKSWDVLIKLLILCINTALIKWVYPQILSTHNKQQYIKINMINTICYLQNMLTQQPF